MAAKKLHLDPRSAMSAHLASSNAAAEDRFARAAQITERQPTGLSPSVEVTQSVVPVQVASSVPQGVAFDIDACVIGATARVPLSLIDLNPIGPRQIYLDAEVDKIAATMPDGQDDAAHGYVEDGRVKLIDGGSRFRAARITDRGFLDVKIEAKPEGDLELFSRARALNERRSATTPLDFAMSLRCLFDRGAVLSNRDVVDRVQAPDGGKLSEALVSMYMRIGRMPEKIQKDMARHPEANTMTALYAVSGLFDESQTEEERDAAVLVAKEVVDEIVLRKLSSKQITALISARKDGPKTRQRSAITPLEFGPGSAWKGNIKTSTQKGKVDLSLQGLAEADVATVRSLLARALEEFASKKTTNES